MKCVFCGGYVPLPETQGEPTACVDCGKGFAWLDRIDIWFTDVCDRYVPADMKVVK